jgi:hypothetical protein
VNVRRFAAVSSVEEDPVLALREGRSACAHVTSRFNERQCGRGLRATQCIRPRRAEILMHPMVVAATG